jgi:hypothetical protein
MKFPGTATELPEAAIWFVYDEWCTLSPKAAAWILPSYLRYVLTIKDEDKYKYSPPATIGWLLHYLRPDPHDAGHADEIRLRFSLLTPAQVAVLLAMLESWKNHPVWSKWSGEEIDAAIAFVSTMKE